MPDYGVFRDSKILFLEIKIGKRKLDPDQEQAFMEIGNDGNIILLCYGFEEARLAIIKFFGLENTQ